MTDSCRASHPKTDHPEINLKNHFFLVIYTYICIYYNNIYIIYIYIYLYIYIYIAIKREDIDISLFAFESTVIITTEKNTKEDRKVSHMVSW